MIMGVQIFEDRYGVVTASFDVASVAADTTAEQTFTVPGLKTGDMVMVNKPALDAGLGVANARVSAADTIAITFVNATAAPVDPSAETYSIFWFRPEKTRTSVTTG
jgi:hypothetical protein